MAVTVTFVGSGDAFGSGGRLQTCILVDGPGIRFTIDFGTSSLIGLKRLEIDPNSIDAVVLTHLHGDHCGGVPFLLLDAMLGSKRTAPLTIFGPSKTADHLANLREAIFPGSSVMEPRFPLRHVEAEPDTTTNLTDMTVSVIRARHTREANPLAVRVQLGRTAIAYTGDGELTDDLMDFVAGVDLLIAESYFFDRVIRGHLNYPDVARLNARRVVLTHMHDNMLAQVDSVPEECAYDGYSITL
jgi:ribonuclease BN (tRNA processing enzyme)